jgi:hypothetical protein
MSGKWEDSWQDLQEGSHAGDCEAKSQIFSQDLGNECQDIVEGFAPSETKEEAAHRARAGGVGALITLGSSGHNNRRKIMVINLDLLAPYEGTARDEQP